MEVRDRRDPAVDRLRRRVAAARGRFQGSWIEHLITQLKTLDAFNWTTIFGAELLWSVLPLLIILNSVAAGGSQAADSPGRPSKTT